MPGQDSGYSSALAGRHTLHHSVGGSQSGANDQTVATAKDGSDFASFLGPLPPFSGKQAARERFSRETFDLPDRYADETQYLTGILDFFIIDKVRRVVCIVGPRLQPLTNPIVHTHTGGVLVQHHPAVAQNRLAELSVECVE